MKLLLLLLLISGLVNSVEGQQLAKDKRFFVGTSYGTSYAIGDFRDNDIENKDAGFAEHGKKLDLYGGFILDKRFILTGGFRYQWFETQISRLVEELRTNNPGFNLNGTTNNWKAWSLLIGLAYKVPIIDIFAIFPRFGLGPLMVQNPGITVSDASGTVLFTRNSETGIGLGYESGFGLRRDLGKTFSLMPTFTFSGGYVNIKDVVSKTDQIIRKNTIQALIQSFNMGLSLAVRFN